MSGGNVLAGDCVRGPIRGTDGDKVELLRKISEYERKNRKISVL